LIFRPSVSFDENVGKPGAEECGDQEERMRRIEGWSPATDEKNDQTKRPWYLEYEGSKLESGLSRWTNE